MVSHKTKHSLTFVSLRVPQGLRILILISVCLLFGVGGSLLFFPNLAQRYWPWTLTPFNARFLGALYFSAQIPLVLCLLRPRQTPLRTVLPMFWAFTTCMLLVSIAHVGDGSFYPQRISPRIWFGLYALDSLGSLYYLVKLWGQFQRQRRKKMSGLWTRILRIQALLLGSFGIALVLLPQQAASLWPWPLDVFHSQLYSSLFLTGALGSWLATRHASGGDRIALGLTQLSLSVLTIIGIGIVDATVHKLKWLSILPWSWLIVLILLGAIGLGLVRANLARVSTIGGY
ncbi:MAG: hypothetical protein WCD18_22035 [Thermosynechococcaceae cyanobacterium]